MTYFLEDIARYLYTKNQGNFQQTIIVFPNRRAKLFFNSHLAKLSDKPMWAPDYYTITDLVKELSGLQFADQVTLLFRLFTLYKEIAGSEDTFDSFYYYCEIMLSDFDDVDKYRIDAAMLYKNLSDLKTIEDYSSYLDEYQLNTIRHFWNVYVKAKDSPEKEKFINLWNIIFRLYTRFVDDLNAEGMAYEGMAYRKAIDKLEKDTIGIFADKQVVFIGFNALNRSEELLFDYFKKRESTLFFWDYDSSYIKNELHEAGFFLRKYIARYPQPADFNPAKINSSDQQVEIISVPSVISQAKAVEYCLNKTNSGEITNPSQTAIILADESLLPSLINSLPANVDEINISMGYPVLNTSAYSFITTLLDLHVNLKPGGPGRHAVEYYYDDLFNILKHIYVRQLIPSASLEKFEQECKKRNAIYIDPSELFPLHPLLPLIFRSPEKPILFIRYLREIIEAIGVYSIRDETKPKAITWQTEILYRIHRVLIQLEAQVESADINIQFRTIAGILRKTLAKTTVPFTGEPLKGMQVMGILETRTLDFDNIILLSMNEGVFPKTGHAPSFIPYALREGFGLPTLRHQDAIFAYYFYRLLHRTKHLLLVYNTKTEGLQKGEPSRFIVQLQYEHSSVVSYTDIGYRIAPFITKKFAGIHSSEVQKKLMRFQQTDGSAFLSPSAINTYLNCKLWFYYKYIEELKEPDDFEEEIEANVFGSILHRSMAILYSDFKKRVVHAEDIKKIMEDKQTIKSAINKAFGELYFHNEEVGESDFRGRNLIIRKVIERYLHGILAYDHSNCPFRIESLEEYYQALIPLEEPGKSVAVGGYIDRLDEKNGTIRVMDYKTGMPKPVFSSVADLFNSSLKKRNDAVFQTFLYADIIGKSGFGLPIQPSLFFVREVFKPDFSIYVVQTENRKKTTVTNFQHFTGEFEMHLMRTLNEMFHPDTMFGQTTNTDLCTKCPYDAICRRNV